MLDEHDASHSSDEAQTTDVTPEDANSHEDAAPSSSANDVATEAEAPEGGKAEEFDPLEAVRSAVENERSKQEDRQNAQKEDEADEAKDASSASDGKSETPEAQAEGEDEISEEELQSYKGKTKKRIETLLEQRAEARKQVEELQPLAEQHRNIQDFMSQNSLSHEEAATGFAIMALMKNDPERARKELQVYIDRLDVAVGAKLPDDLSKKVEDGFLDEETALELSSTRARAEREKAMREAAEQRHTEEAAASQAHTIANSIDDWEREKMKSDPDYSIKKPMIDKFVRAEIAQSGQPASMEAAIQLVDKVYQEVNGIASNMTPKSQPKRVVQSRPVSGNPSPAPSTPLDVVKQALGG